MGKQSRQIKLKWSRTSHGRLDEESLTSIMKEYGDVVAIELLGSKGNSALITFASSSSCVACVDAYRKCDE